VGKLNLEPDRFVEITVRVPLVPASTQGDYGLAMDPSMTREEIVGWMAEEYPSVTGFVNDWYDQDGVKHLVRLRWRGEDKFEEVWRAK
jgi:hypothetical protein